MLVGSNIWQATLVESLSRHIPDWSWTFAGRYKPKDSHKRNVYNKFAQLFTYGHNALPSEPPCGGNRCRLEREFYKHVFKACGWDSSDLQMASAAAAWFRLKHGNGM
jgi:hypothetical protein